MSTQDEAFAQAELLRQQNEAEKLKLERAMAISYSPYVTVNECRAALGLPLLEQVDGGNERLNKPVEMV